MSLHSFKVNKKNNPTRVVTVCKARIGAFTHNPPVTCAPWLLHALLGRRGDEVVDALFLLVEPVGHLAVTSAAMDTDRDFPVMSRKWLWFHTAGPQGIAQGARRRWTMTRCPSETASCARDMMRGVCVCVAMLVWYVLCKYEYAVGGRQLTRARLMCMLVYSECM